MLLLEESQQQNSENTQTSSSIATRIAQSNRKSLKVQRVYSENVLTFLPIFYLFKINGKMFPHFF